MEERVKPFQNRFQSVFETGPKMVEPALRSNEVMLDSLTELAQEQFELGLTCLDISLRQMEALYGGNGISAMWRDREAPGDYHAVLSYGEALSQNARRTGGRMLAICREMADTLNGASAQTSQSTAQVDEVSATTTASAAQKVTSKST
jgi:hypothetical protein